VALFDVFESQDPVLLAQVIVRGADQEKRGSLGHHEISTAACALRTDSRASQMLEKVDHLVDGSELRLNYLRFIEVASGQVIDSGCDSATGKMRTGRCCFLT
jgi:hypothetical protein